ncbi:MAG: fructosamine kinase family protein [Bacteroidia bacterium]|nr:fructosamine kinase family protein [Bacteroidia bacterium]NND51258.1 phosphotransferase [Flavobacteriaceae bacterium]
MISKDLISHISEILNNKVLQVRSIGGGDISEISLLKTECHPYILKTNQSSNALKLFLAEKLGLEAISNTNTIATPKIFACDTYQGHAFLLMEYIESKSPSPKDLSLFGEQLANLHSNTQSDFGFTKNNFIGRLDQSNTNHNTWTSFYVKERLLPQLHLAQSKSLLSPKEIPSEKQLIEGSSLLFNTIKPSLLHGDLWSGNYLISSEGIPYLIDPAVYYGHYEVDIAMSRLFGGFGTEFYEAYHGHYPTSAETEARIKLYQLYYLLVHLNMFGSSYYGSVQQILTTMF